MRGRQAYLKTKYMVINQPSRAKAIAAIVSLRLTIAAMAFALLSWLITMYFVFK